MEKRTIPQTDTSALKKALYEDPNAGFRIKIENSKKQFEKPKPDKFKNAFPSQQKNNLIFLK
ncbi:hypothetical protein OA93_12300 [Flavobacterium sp. KMS]|uniref:hypothetical protein n=1 Tax=Flavobacterium sp. KMS TaxID=1566023 RepID=UPI00057F29DA|nr:hypothetical protein [Flavobacterium sp. KMS]KIA97762.1 hypothetical protein OA93_12300 [Flavobacterium sp. KMS]